MVLLKEFESPTLYRGGYVSIGNFDGVHSGHRKITEKLQTLAEGDGVPSVVLTFAPPPLALLRPGLVPPSLTTLAEKAELLERAGISCVVAYPTDRQLLQLTPEQFFDSIVVNELAA